MFPTRAYRADAEAVVSLRDDLARWQLGSGITQWQPGEITADEVRDQIARQQWWVVRDDGAISATVRVLEADPAIWDDLVDPAADDALYVHGLMVRRAHRGRGLGGALLDWVAGRARDAGRTSVRLDCAAANAGLRAYYADLGFVERGDREFPGRCKTLARFEKPVG
ncbi:GNAT family N-acetyltransferase [Mumia sp. zg.B53]|uniref:GNAT family N-acetyltransferase n=1 Tax=unclassified Mumia TaxID=2621872 RepID=UPI001C6EAE9F|nr:MULTISPECIES: GNAT family N-acetyltransferase [unclassified Mumia]MBW9207308.1 GNAT family N-acetyltransferase [Mumia sp. zg.B17]MBW9210344.1 GNAT family N-acetyltransferase [Mumia sp. zg.B21]MBW9214960.1 GNAT family N-acetyltransferase [Mumia sp. zg.B53]MDD9347316.1 GNAT family N-acetyltransferase [Mumia sp.]